MIESDFRSLLIDFEAGRCTYEDLATEVARLGAMPQPPSLSRLLGEAQLLLAEYSGRHRDEHSTRALLGAVARRYEFVIPPRTVQAYELHTRRGVSAAVMRAAALVQAVDLPSLVAGTRHVVVRV